MATRANSTRTPLLRQTTGSTGLLRSAPFDSRIVAAGGPVSRALRIMFDADPEPREQRRTYLKTAAFAIAGAALPVALAIPAALAADADIDASLLDLWRRREQMCAAERGASKRLDAISMATIFPEPSEAVFLRESDHDLGLAKYTSVRHCGRRWYPFEAADAERRGWRRNHWRWGTRPVTPEDNLPDGALTTSYREPWPEAKARADEIARAWDRHRAAMETIGESSGLVAANAEWEARDDDLAAIDGAIGEATAHTFAGLTVKARLAQIDIDKDSEPDRELIAGLVRDILAMGGQACA